MEIVCLHTIIYVLYIVFLKFELNRLNRFLMILTNVEHESMYAKPNLH